MRHRAWFIAAAIFALVGCSDDEQSDESSPPTFELEVEASPTLVDVGEQITLEAKVVDGAPDGDVTVTWSLEGHDDVTGESATFTLSEPGQSVVDVKAEDTAGNTVETSALITAVESESRGVTLGDVDGDGTLDPDDVASLEEALYGEATLGEAEYDRADVWPDFWVDEEDLELVRAGAEEGEIATTVPSEGSIGARVTIVHQGLVEATGPITVTFGDTAEQTAFQSKPGYAVAMVPRELTEAQTVDLEVRAGGDVVATLPFDILDAPEASADPGAKVYESVERLQTNLEKLPGLTDRILDEVDATEEEKETIAAMLEVANEDLGKEYPKLVEALKSLPEEQRADYERAALSNGLDEVLRDLDEIEASLQKLEEGESALSPTASERIIDFICTAQEIADASAKVAEINEAAAYYLDKASYLEWVPVVGQAIKILRTASAIIGTITDIIELVAGFIPDISKDVQIDAETATMVIGEKTGLTASFTLKVTRVCINNADTIVIGPMVEYFENMLAKRIASLSPNLSAAAEALGYDPAGRLAEKAIETTGFESFMQGLAEKVCKWIGDDPNLEVEPDWEAGCGIVESDATWTCTEECAEETVVTVTAKKKICDSPPRSGSTDLTCLACLEGSNCDQTCCGDSCVDTMTDDQNCGSCDFVCPTDSTCESGTCACDDPDLEICDGACVDTDTSIDHCGGCGSPCEIPGAITDCQGGTCEMIGCQAGFGDCDDDPTNGCETDTDSNDQHCGLCGIECPSGAGCKNGTCTSTDAVIGTGADHSCYADGGELWCWGANDYGQIDPNGSDEMAHPIPTKVAGFDTVASLGLMWKFTCLLLEDGTVTCFGNADETGNPSKMFQVGNLSGVVEMETGGTSNFGCALDQMGRLMCWGDTSPLTNMSPASRTDATEFTGWGDVADFCVGDDAACAVDSSGDVRCLGELWGARYEDPQSGAATDCQNFCRFPEPAKVLDLPPVVEVECGNEHFCGRTSAGEIYCWGTSNNGRLGDGNYTCGDVSEYSAQPAKVAGISSATSFGVGSTFACATLQGGEVKCWGANYAGQLGTGEHGTVICYPSPGSAVSNISMPAQLDFGGAHSCALTTVGDVYCWGRNRDGQLGTGNAVEVVDVPVQAMIP